MRIVQAVTNRRLTVEMEEEEAEFIRFLLHRLSGPPDGPMRLVKLLDQVFEEMGVRESQVYESMTTPQGRWNIYDK